MNQSLFEKWFSKTKQLRPHENKAHVRNWAWLLSGIFLSCAVHLSKIARKIPGTATATSSERRPSRLLDNPAIRVREWYKAIAQPLLESVAQNVKEIRLIVDGTKIGFGHQLLMVSVAYRRRAIPIAWIWIRFSCGHSTAWKQLALLSYVRSLIPAGTRVLLVGDSEFGSVDVLQALNHWKWKPGRLTQKHAYCVNLLAHWQVGEDEPWLLATNLLSLPAALAAYRRRMWIEEMFGDLKKHGFDLESTHLRHFMRLSRLTLAVALLYVWLIAFGTPTIKAGARRLVDRADRRDLSIFHIGSKMLDRCLTNVLPFAIHFCFYS